MPDPWRKRVEPCEGAVCYLGNCLEILPTLVAGSVDAVVTDPPYGTEDLAGGYGRRQNWDVGDGKGRVIVNDHDLSALAEAFPLCLQTIANGWALVFYAARKVPAFVQATCSATWFGSIVWDKARPGLGYHICYMHEDIAVFRVGDPQRPPTPLFSIIRALADNKGHPHAKPIRLMGLLVGWASGEGLTVLDPFMGGGATGVAAMLQGRRFVGMEIDEGYFEKACQRIADATPLFAYQDTSEPGPGEATLFEETEP